MTWGITDIYVLMENTKYFLQDDRLYFIDNYTNLQDYCEDMLIQKNIKNNEKSAGKQMGLTTATELLEISLDNISHHRALDDSIIAYECFKNLYSYPILLSHIQKFNDEFYRKLTFKILFFVTSITLLLIKKKCILLVLAVIELNEKSLGNFRVNHLLHLSLVNIAEIHLWDEYNSN